MIRRAILFVALLAFAWQGIVAQVHRHAGVDVAGPAFGESRAAPSVVAAGLPASDLPATCPICHEIAHAGAYLLSGAAAFHAPAILAQGVSLSRLTALHVAPWSHGWRSRAPPNTLQA